jgi:hypothetical protein
MVSAGSWFGLPDFGVTEKLGSLLGSPTTAQGGSNIFGGQSASTPTYNGPISSPGINYSSGGSVLGAKTGTLSGSGSTTPQQTYQDPLSGAAQVTQSEGDAYLQSLNTEYDRAAEELRAQLGQAGTAREQGLSSLQGAVDQYGNLIGQQKQSAQQATDKSIQSAGSTARQTQGKSRNVLRALGILSSSAAGDILNRPMTEFGTQRADLQQGLIQRTQELDNALAQKTSEHAQLVKNLESQYAEMVGNIQRDLRFSDRERADAVAAAKSAVLSRLSDIRTAQANWQNDINAAKQGLTASAAGFGSYVNPTADLASISNQGLTTTQQYKPNTQQVSTYGEQKKRLSDYTPENIA